ncbi:MAG: hypothetical protein RL736_209, partial [Pseudomonadota bacterium]
MDITGTVYRSIASQDEFSYDLSLSINNSTGTFNFGFSGDNEYLQLFTFNSGKVLDFYKRHVWSYNPRETLYLSGNIGSGYLNYFINENPICLFSYNSGNHFKYITFASSHDTVASTNINIYGNTPKYTFIQPLSGITLGQDIFAQISNKEKNKEKSFEIFSGNFTSQNYYCLYNFDKNFISGLKTGNLIFRYNSDIPADTVQSGIPPLTGILGVLTLNTNFGNITTEYNFKINSPPFYFDSFENILNEFAINLSTNLYERNYQYRLNMASSDDQVIYIKYYNISGHNNEIITGSLFSTGNLITNNLSGFIYGEDFLTGIGTGYIFSTTLDNDGNILNKALSGSIKQLRYATGQIDYFYNVLITGSNYFPTYINDFTLLESYSNQDFVSNNTFFGKSISVSHKGDVILVGSTGFSDEIITGYGNVSIYSKQGQSSLTLTQTLSPNQTVVFFRTGVSPTITGFLTGYEVPTDSPFSFNTVDINTINLVKNLKTISIFVTGNYGLDQNGNGPFFCEWLESSGNNDYANFNLFDQNNIQRLNSSQSKNGLYTGYLPETTNFLRLNYPFGGGSGAITGLIDISYVDKNIQGMNFGHSLDLNSSGSIIAVGAPRYTINNTLKDIGSVWIYTGINNNWILSQIITGSSKNQYLGESLSLEENTLVIGNRSESGVLIYERPSANSFFNLVTGLTSNITGFKGFGYSLDLSQDGNLLAVGAPSNNIQYPNIYNSGKVQVYKKIGSTWPLVTTLQSNIQNFSKLFFPALGDHDYDSNIGEQRLGNSFISYFSILGRLLNSTSNNSKYYDFKIGSTHFFVLDSEPLSGGSSEDGNITNGAGIGDKNLSSSSNIAYTNKQKEWFNKAIKNSDSKYKFVFFHHPSFNTGGVYRGFPNLSPYKGWKIHLADAVYNGHEHIYERLKLNYQNPSNITTEIIGEFLQILYTNGGLFNTSQLKINISYNDQQHISVDTQAGNMSYDSTLNAWKYLYPIPSNTDYVNFYFKSANGTFDRNTLNNRNYDYIHYINDSNNFTKTNYFIVGNGGINLGNVRSDAGFLNWQGIVSGDFYGFTRTDVYESGLKFGHFGLKSGTTSLQLQDNIDVGNTTTPILLSFATIADWGQPNNNILTPPLAINFKNPSNNYYAEKIASTIRSQNINYVFGIGNLNYNLSDPLSRSNSSYPVAIDENVGSFYFDYLPCYRGVYSGYTGINSNLISEYQPSGISQFTGECALAKFGINNSKWGDTTIDGFGESVYVGGSNNNIIIVGGAGNVGYLNNGSVWVYTGLPFNQVGSEKLVINKNISNPEVNSSGNYFGNSIYSNKDCSFLIIGSPGFANNSGSVYLYTGYNGWGLKQKIQQPSVLGKSNFGFSVASSIDGDNIVIGNSNNNSEIFIYNSNIYTNFVSNQTGLLSGFITSNQGSYTWNNISITGTGIAGSVFLDKIIGYKQATGSLIFLDNTG